MIARKAEAVLRHFTDRISNTELRLRVNNSHGQDGVAFLTAIEQELNTPSSIRDATAAARYAMLLDHRKMGLTRATTEVWTTFLNLDHAHWFPGP